MHRCMASGGELLDASVRNRGCVPGWLGNQKRTSTSKCAVELQVAAVTATATAAATAAASTAALMKAAGIGATQAGAYQAAVPDREDSFELVTAGLPAVMVLVAPPLRWWMVAEAVVVTKAVAKPVAVAEAQPFENCFPATVGQLGASAVM